MKVLTLEINDELKVLEVHTRELPKDNRLQSMYKILNCDCVTCTEIDVDDHFYDVWSDDEALLKNNAIPTLYINDNTVIFGNLLFAKSDKNGKMLGLTESDMQRIRAYIHRQDIKMSDWIKRINSKA